MTGVMIGVDPHKGSHTAVVLDEAETVLGQFRVLDGMDYNDFNGRSTARATDVARR